MRNNIFRSFLVREQFEKKMLSYLSLKQSFLFCKLIFIIPVFLTISCTNGYIKFYSEFTSIDKLDNVQKIGIDQKPEIRYCENIDEEYFEVLSNNYVCLGVSSFEGVRNNPLGVEKKALEVGATLAIWSKKYSRTIGSSTTATLSSDGKTVTTTNSGTILYDQKAYYFVKSTRKFLLGFGYDDIDNESKKTLSRNTGVKVLYVIKNSPVYYENIVRGDVISKMNDVEIRSKEDMESEIKKIKAGDIVKFTIIRQTGELEIKVNV